MAKSHRTSNDKELIRWDKGYAKIKGKKREQLESFLMIVLPCTGGGGGINGIA